MTVLRTRGVPVGGLVRRLFDPALKRIGHMWQDRQITVADEHVATAITEECLNAAAAGIAPPVRRGRVLLTVAEGEWHTLPLRMVALVWRELGWDVVAVSPSLPTEDLVAMAYDDPCTVGAVSCAMTSNLVGAWHCVAAMRLAGMRVVVGGGAFEAEPRLADRIGADAHAIDPVHAGETLVQWLREAPLPSREPALKNVLPEIDRVWTSLPRSVEDAIGLIPQLGPVDIKQDLLRDDLTLVARAATAAALVGAPEVLADHLDWYRSRSATRGDDGTVADTLVAALGRMLPPGSATVRHIMAAAVSG